MSPTIALLWLGPVVCAQASTITVSHNRPSRLIGQIHALVPSTVKVVADDEAGVLRVTGAKERLKEVEEYVRLFDVEPRRVSINLHLESQIDHTESDWSLTGRNNSKLLIADDTINTEVGMTPRINADGTLTLFVEFNYRGAASKAVVRLKMGESYTFGMGPHGLDPTPKQAVGKLSYPEVTIRASDAKIVTQSQK